MPHAIDPDKVVVFGMRPLGNGFLSTDEFAKESFYPTALGFSEKSVN